MTYDTVQIVQRLAPGGIEVLATRLAASMPGINAIVSLEGTVAELQAAWPFLAQSGIEVMALDKPAGLRPSTAWQLASLLRRLRPNCVITHHIGPLLYGGTAARLAGVRNLVHVEHDVWHHRDPGRDIQLQMARRLLRPTFAAISRHAADTLARNSGARAVVLLPNGVDLGAYAPGDRAAARRRLGLPADVRVIGSVGRLEPVKGHAALLQAAAALPEDVHVAIVGDGSQRANLEALAAELGIASRVVLAGHRDDVATLYPAFDVLCLPSRQEGLPFVVIEAQACDTPVVATDVGAVRDALCPETSRLVRPGDLPALVRALRDVVDQRSRPSPRAPSPRAFVARHFDWDATLRRYTLLAKG
jgi:glycosyltransferase involved in cell wall biosynthesis